MTARQRHLAPAAFAWSGTDEHPSRAWSRPGPGLALAVLGAIAVLRLAALAINATDLYMDEAQYWAWAQAPAFGYFSKPPLIAWIIGATTAVCEDGEACVRLPSVLLHFATAVAIYVAGRELVSREVGFWSALGYALLPAVSLSSGIISTDVALLTAWAVALMAFARLIKRPTAGDAALLAVALGLGLNAKYAMAYFFVCAGVFFVIAPEARARLRSPHLWLAAAGGIAMLIPNLAWNAAHEFATLAHTADNANWSAASLRPLEALEFLLTQFGVFGPILFGALGVIMWRAVRSPERLTQPERLLLAFSVPIILIVTAQALVSRAHANWAAPAYVAGVILVTATMLRDREWFWMRTGFGVNAAVAVLVALATWQAGSFALPYAGDPFARTLGNRALAAAVARELEAQRQAGQPVGAILTEDRAVAAALAYYGRDLGVPMLAWRAGDRPRSYFEAEHPFTVQAPGPALLVTDQPKSHVAAAFQSVRDAKQVEIAAGRTARRTISFAVLNGYRGRGS